MRKTGFVITAYFLACLAAAQAETIAMIGTGNVGSALGPEFAAQGHAVVYGSRDPSKHGVQQLVERTGNGASATTQAAAAAGADIVVLAVPGMHVAEITQGLGDLSGKIIIDPTNPLENTNVGMTHGAVTSNAEIIQILEPEAKVVKAFNTLGWKVMIDPDIAGGSVSIPLAGNSDNAKDIVAQIVTGMGLEPIDVGPVEHARWLEGMAILLINNNYFSPRPDFNFYLRKSD